MKNVVRENLQNFKIKNFLIQNQLSQATANFIVYIFRNSISNGFLVRISDSETFATRKRF